MENPETLATCGHMTQIEDKKKKQNKNKKKHNTKNVNDDQTPTRFCLPGMNTCVPDSFRQFSVSTI